MAAHHQWCNASYYVSYAGLAVCGVEQTSERCCNSALRPGFVFIASVIHGGDTVTYGYNC